MPVGESLYPETQIFSWIQRENDKFWCPNFRCDVTGLRDFPQNTSKRDREDSRHWYKRELFSVFERPFHQSKWAYIFFRTAKWKSKIVHERIYGILSFGHFISITFEWYAINSLNTALTKYPHTQMLRFSIFGVSCYTFEKLSENQKFWFFFRFKIAILCYLSLRLFESPWST
jgi:hypothetical protein